MLIKMCWIQIITSVYRIFDTSEQKLEKISYEMRISNHHNHKERLEELQYQTMT